MVLLVLGESGAHVAVELVVRIAGAGFKRLPIQAGCHAYAPVFVEPVAAPDIQVVATAVAAGRAVLIIEVQALAATGHDGTPLADGLPLAVVRLPLVAQFV